MHKYLIEALAVITAGTLGLSALILPSPARSQETKESCELGILNAKNRIEEGRDITVITNVIDASKKYPDHPDNRPRIVMIAVDGIAADSIMVSPVFRRAITSEIIKSCNSVGAVTFNRYQTSWLITVGLMKDGSIQNFQCLLKDRRTARPSWGEEWCDI
ncbi:hypothetical protein [Microcoleus sp. FACHB-68]|uniref:hypothetical protein n=1 Tax=Microcoleus sp. FACHB-68 TaxID=2692826 RepID=UPI00168283C6|nr:hypothetical protein [Microcoleus sp. FACHB-68]MBD1936745.1 hypothetical protein [Microcoleus sp. FACHB-68]